MMPAPVEPHDDVLRLAARGDLPALVALLADDAVAAERESGGGVLDPAYERAFEAIDADPNHELLVIESRRAIVAALQLSFLPNLTYRGGLRAQIEGVRVAAHRRGAGYGERLVGWAVERARERGCRLVQLTTDKRREAAVRFYERLGFRATHEGMKLRL